MFETLNLGPARLRILNEHCSLGMNLSVAASPADIHCTSRVQHAGEGNVPVGRFHAYAIMTQDNHFMNRLINHSPESKKNGSCSKVKIATFAYQTVTCNKV